MAFAIKRLNGDIIWFDAVRSYSESHSGSATQHPVEDGSSISDFFIKGNPTYSLDAVISDADFNLNRVESEGTVSNNEPILSKQSVVITETLTNPLISLLPENIAGLLQKDAEVSVQVATSRKEKMLTIKNILLTIHDKGEPFTLLSFKNGKLFDTPLSGCLLTSINFTESAETGDALYPSMSIQKVNVVTIRRGTTPRFRAHIIVKEATSPLQKTAGGAGKSVKIQDSVESVENAEPVFSFKSVILQSAEAAGFGG